ncbi:MAG TPA: glycosyltransferase family 2 protein [Stenomitos sp.]
MRITVIIPTYARSQDLARCCLALQAQDRLADEVLVVVRDVDTETWQFLQTFDTDAIHLRSVTVRVPGQVAALNAGLEAAQGDIIAITDDDAVPHPDWLARIEAHFVNQDSVGGVGGKDWLYEGDRLVDGKLEVVGKVQWFGRVIFSQHLGYGAFRSVDVLKGANMSFRTSAIAGLRFDTRLRGTGAQVANDAQFCLMLKRRGWVLIYDPAVAVDHYPGQRFDVDQRLSFNAVAQADMVHNRTLMILEHLPPLRRCVFMLWAILVGTRGSPGIVQWLRFLPSEGSLATQKILASLKGRWQGWQTWQRTKTATFL